MKGKLLIVGVFIVVVVLVFGGFEYTYEKVSVGGFATYQNEDLGISFQYPKGYHKVTDEMYPLPLITFVSSPECTFATVRKFREVPYEEVGDCFMLNVWQQPDPYRYNRHSRTLFDQRKVSVGDVEGVATASVERDLRVHAVQIPRYDALDSDVVVGELIVEYFYHTESARHFKEVSSVLLETLRADRVYVPVAVSECCEQEVPTTLMQSGKDVFLLQDNALQKIPIDTEDSIGHVKLSPDGSSIAFFYFDYERDKAGLFESARTGMAVTAIKPPYETTHLVRPGTHAHTYLDWSPDGRYLSYILDDGRGVGMMDVLVRQEVFRFLAGAGESGGAPVAWLNKDEMSFTYGDALYVGTPQNPRREIVADGVSNYQSGYESPGTLYMPIWSPDGSYVFYRTTGPAVVQDVRTGEKYPLGKQVGHDFVGGPFLSIEPVGWTMDGAFLFQDLGEEGNGGLKSAIVKGGALLVQDVVRSGDVYTLVEHGPHLISHYSSGHGSNWYEQIEVYDVHKKDVRCSNLQIGMYLGSKVSKSDGRTYLFANPLLTDWVHWQNGSFLATDPSRGIVEIFDIDSCVMVGAVDVGRAGRLPHIQ